MFARLDGETTLEHKVAPAAKPPTRHSSPNTTTGIGLLHAAPPAMRLMPKSQGAPTPAPAPRVSPPIPPPPRTPPPAPAPAPAPAPTTPPPVTGTLTARDNFSGRSTVLFGVGEIIDLSFRVTPPLAVPAGLRWVLVVGGGTLTPGATAGTATYTAPGTLAIVTLQLADASTIYSTHVISIIPPLDAVMEQAPGTGIRHTNGKWGVGFKALTFLRPKTVSFSRIETREGTVAAVTSGYLSPLSATHATGSWATVGSGNSSKGCKENTVDQIFSGELDPPFGSGSFLWAIPWQYRVGGGSAITYTTANHKATAIHVPSLGIDGAAFIEKKGAGPFRRDAADPTTSW